MEKPTSGEALQSFKGRNHLITAKSLKVSWERLGEENTF